MTAGCSGESTEAALTPATETLLLMLVSQRIERSSDPRRQLLPQLWENVHTLAKTAIETAACLRRANSCEDGNFWIRASKCSNHGKAPRLRVQKFPNVKSIRALSWLQPLKIHIAKRVAKNISGERI